MKRLAFALVLVGCEAEPVLPGEADSARGQVPFADAAPLLDGVVVRADARLPLPDAARFDDAGRVCRTGRVRGTVCAPNEQAIVGARVSAATTDCDGREVTVTTESRAGGRFQLTGLAPGPTQVTIHAGQFVARAQVVVIADTVVPINGDNEKLCFGADQTRLAVLAGEYDRIQEVLDGLELSYTLFCGDASDDLPARRLLTDREALAAFEVLFINCGSGIDLRSTNGEIDEMVENLRWFVAQGGSVYASDLAADFVERGWPGRVGFVMNTARPSAEPACCVCGDCAPQCIAAGLGDNRCGTPAETPPACRGHAGVSGGGGSGVVVGATIAADYLRQALGADTLDVVFNLGGWVPIGPVADEVQVLVHDDGAPLMVQFEPDPGGGRVAFTSFHNHAQVTRAMRRILEALVFRL